MIRKVLVVQSLFLFAIVLFAGTGAFAQTTATPTPSPTPKPGATPRLEDQVIEIDTELVNISVRVVDRNNRPINNLPQTDFKIYEDGALQAIDFFSKSEVPTNYSLVIDNSGSLRQQIEQVIEAGKTLIGANRPDDETAIIRFVSSDKIEVLQDFSKSKTDLNDALDNMYIEGGQTAIIDAVYRTAEMVQKYQNSQKKEDVKIRTLILVSDGDDRGSQFTEKLLFELLRNSYVQIYAIGFTNDLSDVPDPETGISRRQRARAFLTRLAQETGGKVYFPDSIEQLGKIALEISGELRTQYVVSYSPTNTNRDGSFRQIKVEVSEGTTGEKRTAITRTGRNAAVNK